VPFPAADQKTLDDLPGFTAAKKAEIEKLESEIKENEQSLDAVLKEMKLIPA
jgi:wobble nucleotide-excising tRNase